MAKKPAPNSTPEASTTPSGGFAAPAELRSMAENSMAQARQAFDGFVGMAQGAMSRIEARAAAVHTGSRHANERIMSFAQQNIANSFDYAERLVSAKNMSEIMQIHADFAKKQMQAFAEQAKELGQAAAQSATGTAPNKKAAE